MRRFFVYMLECSDGSLYTGYTTDVARRLARHRSGRGSKYVASRLPFTLAYLEEAPSLEGAMRREREIKRMRREGKLRLRATRKEVRRSQPSQAPRRTPGLSFARPAGRPR